jgi:hypothetical protein
MSLTYTNLQVAFAQYDTPLFSIWRTWDMPETSNYVLPATTGIDDPNYPGMIFADTAILFTRGRWSYDCNDVVSTFSAGDGGIKSRYPQAYRVMARDAQNGKICVRPKDGEIWERSVVAIPNQEAMDLGPWDEDRYLIVGSGKLLLDNDVEIISTTPFKVTAGDMVHVRATAAVLALLMWK